MVTQKEVFFAIEQDEQNHGLEYAKQRVVEYQKRLYANDLEGDLRFYVQDVNGIPKGRIPTMINGKKRYSTLLLHNDIKRQAWQEPPIGPEKSEGWDWCNWPPRTVNDLTGCRSVWEFCAKCEDPHKPSIPPLDDAYARWVPQVLDFWHNNIYIWNSIKTGYGLHARNRIPKGVQIGEYTGLIVPYYGDENDDIASHYMEIDAGPLFLDSTRPKYTCRLEATRRGSIFRFMNHSCEPNTRAVQMRYGIHHRINVIITTEDIEPGEQITMSYAKDWFNDNDHCWCRKKSCEWGQKRRAATAAKSARVVRYVL